MCQWIETHCRFTSSEFARRPFLLQPWQVFLVACVFGWTRADARRFKHVHLWVARKSGKSELAAAIGLWMLLADGEGNPLVCATAASERQARLVPTAAWHMAGGLGEVGKRVKRNRMSERNPPIIEIDGGLGAFRGLPRDISGSLDGLSPSCAIIDEIHAYRTPDTYAAMSQGMGARRRGLLLVISTAGDVDGVGRQQFDLAASVLAGDTRKDDLFALVFDAPRNLDIQDEATWRLANPSIGVTVDVDHLRSLAAEAAATGEEEVFRRKQLNQWAPRADGGDAWIDAAAWDACPDAGKAARRAWVGLATASDCATTLLWRRGKRWCAAIRLWESEHAAARWVARKARKRRLTCAVDSASALLVRRLERDGIECVTVRRSTLSHPMKALAAHVAAGTWRHRSSASVRDQMAGVVDGRPDAEAPLSVLAAFAVALADDGERGATMRDIPAWKAI